MYLISDVPGKTTSEYKITHPAEPTWVSGSDQNVHSKLPTDIVFVTAAAELIFSRMLLLYMILHG